MTQEAGLMHTPATTEELLKAEQQKTRDLKAEIYDFSKEYKALADRYNALGEEYNALAEKHNGLLSEIEAGKAAADDNEEGPNSKQEEQA